MLLTSQAESGPIDRNVHFYDKVWRRDGGGFIDCASPVHIPTLGPAKVCKFAAFSRLSNEQGTKVVPDMFEFMQVKRASNQELFNEGVNIWKKMYIDALALPAR